MAPQPAFTALFLALTLASARPAAALALAGPQEGVPGSAPAAEPTIADRLARLEREVEEKRISLHVPGLALAVVRDGEVIFAKGFGLARLEPEVPVTPETIFAIGSSTKAFTATLVGMLVDEGKLAWDDPVTKVLPEFVLPIQSDDDAACVTFRDLLAHRTGFARADLLWAAGKADTEQILRTIVKAEPWKGFREEFHYNNIMFLAAGHAAGVASGKPWSTLLRERLLEPLGMASTTSSSTAAQEDPRLAHGYVWNADEETFELQTMRNLDGIAPAGAINSNVLDMARWVEFQLARGELDGRRLLSEAAHRETWTRQIDMGPDDGYGLGWFLHDWKGQPVVEHGGNIDGYGAQVAMLPESDLGYVLLTNVTATPLQAGSMELVWEALLGAVSEPQTVVGDHTPYLGAYVANFATFQDTRFEVLEQDGKLAVDVPGQMVFTLEEPDAEGKWTFELTDTIAVSFERGADGRVLGMKMYQSGMTFELPREGVEIPVEIDLEDARRYVGQYADPKLESPLKVLIRNNRLAVDVPQMMVCELHAPDAEGKRFLRVRSDFAVRFDEDPDGTVRSFTIFERGVERTCPRIAGADSPEPIALEELHALRRSDERAEAVAALGAWRTVGTVAMVHTGIEGRTTITATADGRHAAHADLEPFATIDLAYDGELAVLAGSIIPYRELSGGPREKLRVDHPAAHFGDWRAFFSSITVLRADQLDGRAVWVVKLGAGEDVELTAWVDAETGDTLREDSFEFLPGGVGKLPVTRRFHDFREVAGLRIAHRTESEDEATGRSVFTVERIDLHAELPEGSFRIAPPASGERQGR